MGDWGKAWNALEAVDSYFELVALVAARWECLGGLYLGTASGRSDCDEAVAYVARFVEPIQPRYADLHDVTLQQQKGSDFFTMFRNKPFHGVSPVPTAFHGDREVVGWAMGTRNEIPTADHLTIDARGNVVVNCTMVRDEMLSSMSAFADYLDANVAVAADVKVKDARTPHARMQRAFWWQNKPRHYAGDWMKEGIALGIPA
jgi:hypothetical protein